MCILCSIIERDSKLEIALKEFFWSNWWNGDTHKADSGEIPHAMIEYLVQQQVLDYQLHQQIKINWKYLGKRRMML